MRRPVYLDYNATTPHDPEVIAAMRPFLETEFGNPSSAHAYGVAPREAVRAARGQVANLLGCRPEDIIFTSGGTESNNHAIRGAALALRGRGKHIVTSAIEHPAVLEVCRDLETLGFDVTYLPVDGHGRVSVASVADALCPDTTLVSLMHANNEVGTVQPLAEIAALTRPRGIVLHTDAAQSVGKIPVRVDELGVDLLSIAGHKLYAPKGVGALYVRPPLRLAKLLHGAGQERGWRAGTENVLGIVGLGQACAVAARDPAGSERRLRTLRDRLGSTLLAASPDSRIHGDPDHGLPNTLSIAFAGLAAQAVLAAVAGEVAASAGAACHSGGAEPSHVLAAMGVSPGWAASTLRLSVGRMTTTDEVDRAAHVLTAAVRALRGTPGCATQGTRTTRSSSSNSAPPA